MQGIAMDGFEMKDMILQVRLRIEGDTSAWARLNDVDENVNVEFLHRRDAMNPEDWVEVCLNNDARMFNLLARVWCCCA